MRRLLNSVVDLGRRALARFVELEAFDRSMALAGQAFAALLPLLIVVGAVSPGGEQDFSDTLVDRFDLTGQTEATLEAYVNEPAAVQDSITMVGSVILVISALSFTRAMQRLYVRAWRLPKLGFAGNAWGLGWLFAFCAYWLLQPVLISVFDGVVATGVSIALSAALWLFTPWILVGRRIPWHRLLPQALLTTVGVSAFAVTSVVYMPHAVTSAAREFGFIGVAFSLLSWLFVLMLVLVVAAALGAVLVERGPVDESAGAVQRRDD